MHTQDKSGRDRTRVQEGHCRGVRVTAPQIFLKFLYDYIPSGHWYYYSHFRDEAIEVREGSHWHMVRLGWLAADPEGDLKPLCGAVCHPWPVPVTSATLLSVEDRALASGSFSSPC